MGRIVTAVFGSSNEFTLNVENKDGEVLSTTNVTRMVADFGGSEIDSALDSNALSWDQAGGITFKIVEHVPVGIHDLHLKVFTPVAPEGFSLFHRDFEWMNFKLHVTN